MRREKNDQKVRKMSRRRSGKAKPKKQKQDQAIKWRRNQKKSEQPTEIVKKEKCEEGEKTRFFGCYLLTSLSPRFKGHSYIGSVLIFYFNFMFYKFYKFWISGYPFSLIKFEKIMNKLGLLWIQSDGLGNIMGKLLAALSGRRRSVHGKWFFAFMVFQLMLLLFRLSLFSFFILINYPLLFALLIIKFEV